MNDVENQSKLNLAPLLDRLAATTSPMLSRTLQYREHIVDKRITGDGPFGIAIRLAVMSLIVGVVLSALGISPANLFYSLNVLARRLYDMGFGAFEWVLQYMLVGAMVVVPIWIVARILGAFKARRD